MVRIHTKPRWIQRLVRWLFGSPFWQLSPEFGDSAPPELGAFEAEMMETQHRVHTEGWSPSAIHSRQSKSARRDKSLERQ